MGHARRALDERLDVAVVFGRRRELHPNQTVYNRLADLEWNVPIGEVKACGGDAMIRAEAFHRVNGYDSSIIAAEDDELCLRIRKEGWIILRIDADMTLHDMAMTRFQQWWMRSVRCGHAYAEGSARYGHTPENHFVRETRSCPFLGVSPPAAGSGSGLAYARRKSHTARRLRRPFLADTCATIGLREVGLRRTPGSMQLSASSPSFHM